MGTPSSCVFDGGQWKALLCDRLTVPAGETVGVVAGLVSRGFDNTVHCSFAVHAALRIKSQDRISASFVPAHLLLKASVRAASVCVIYDKTAAFVE